MPVLPLLAAMIAAAAPQSAAPSTPAGPALAKALAGRTAGTPQDCISLPTQARGSTIVDGTAVIYKENRRRWWVNFPEGGRCSALRPSRAIVTVSPTSQLCSLQLIRVVDFRPAPFDYGQCALGPFIPYTR